MAELLSAAQMRAIEGAAIVSGTVSGLDLMERAGQGVVDAILAEWPAYRSAPQSAAILCGPGNNGGDGFVIARLLRDLGWQVAVWLFGDPEKLPPNARVNHDRWAAFEDVRPGTCQDFRGAPPATLVVDAIFGTGLSRAPDGEIGELLRYLAGYGGDTYDLVAVDAPSGLCLDSGRALGAGEWAVPQARVTVTFDSPKLGHYLAAGPELCGKLVVADIGLRTWREVEGGTPGPVRRPDCILIDHVPLVPDRRGWAALDLPGLLLKRAGHKYDHGHALVLSGPPGRGGAARLAARAALRVGAGLVTLGCPLRAMGEHAARLDAIMLRGLDGPPGLAEMLEDARISALCLGPGLGLGPATAELVRFALASGRAAVLDADALSRFERQPQTLFDMTMGKPAVLTPHAGEFRRLFPDLADQLDERPTAGPACSRVDAARAAAERAGCTVLLKGPDTVIATPQGRVAVNAAVYDRAVPWLATAGAGDVLSGIIAGLLARGIPPFEAAAAGVWLHVESARAFGPGLIAEDLPETLPAVLRALSGQSVMRKT